MRGDPIILACRNSLLFYRIIQPVERLVFILSKH
nr:MAG TPA: hypothetical protein [Caudoviricetes sp.]DAS59884.1 MAG TPA: hypothetical protein [Caudoviricetes sp.]